MAGRRRPYENEDIHTHANGTESGPTGRAGDMRSQGFPITADPSFTGYGYSGRLPRGTSEEMGFPRNDAEQEPDPGAMRVAGRNALKGQMDAAPGPTAPAPEPGPSPEAEMERLMRETGYKGSDPAEGMAHVWKVMPTDDVAELIDMLSAKHGLPTPFPKGKEGDKPSKLGGPQQEAREFVPERQEREMSYPLSNNDYGDGQLISAPANDFEEESMGRASVPARGRPERDPLPPRNALMRRRA